MLQIENETINFNLKRPYFSGNEKTFYFLLLTVGILFRLFHYCYNRSLWMDEVYLSSSIINRDYYDIVTKPLDYEQKAPLGFLLLVKCFVNLFGNNEAALRLLSLISGILSLFVFVPVASYFTEKRGVLIGLAIIAMAPPLIFHAVEVKQYQMEMLSTLLILWSYIYYHNQLSSLSNIKWAIIGAVLIWFSYSSIFILMGIAGGLTIYNFRVGDTKKISRQFIVFFIWITSFAINYVLFTYKHAESKWIVYWFDYYRTFAPFPPKSTEDLKWYVASFYQVMNYPLGLVWKFYALPSAGFAKMAKVISILPISLLLIGLYGFYKKKNVILILIFPLFLVWIASGMKLYPLTGRFWVFISPLFILFIAQGYVQLCKSTGSKIVRFLIPLILIFGLFNNAFAYLRHPETFLLHKRSFQREALTFVNSKFKPGDVVYVYWNDLPGFKVYKEISDLKFVAIEGKDYRQVSMNYTDYLNRLKSDLNRLGHKKRIWVLYNEYYFTTIGDQIDQPEWYYKKGQAPTRRFIDYLSTLGKQTEVFKSFDVQVNLIELKNE